MANRGWQLTRHTVWYQLHSVGAEAIFAVHVISSAKREAAVSETKTLCMQSFVVAAKDQVSSDLNGEAVILDLKSGVYHGLDPTGAFIWNLIQQRRAVSEVRDAILAEYDVPPDVCERDVMTLVQQLVDKGLAEVTDGSGA